MTYTPTVTATAGQPLAAANFNAGIRDNFAALGEPWTPYTPTWAATGTPPAIVNGSLAGRYRRFGKTLDLHLAITMGSTTTYGTGVWSVSLPAGITGIASPQVVSLICSNAGIASYIGLGLLDSSSTSFLCTIHTGGGGGAVALAGTGVPFAWGTADYLVIQGTIEVA